MGIVRTTAADGKSAITQFISLLICQRDLIDFAVARDAEAIRILTAPGLPEVIHYEERRFWALKFGRSARKVRTRRDERRLGWIKGWQAGCTVPCRLAYILRRFGDRHVDAYRASLDEVRRDGTAAVISPKLAAAKEAHERLFARAREICQWQAVPLPRSINAEFAEHSQAVSNLVHSAPFPQPITSGQVTIAEVAALAGVAKKTIENKGKLPTPLVQQVGRSPARYDYVAFRAWIAEYMGNRLATFPEDYQVARQRIDALMAANSRG